MVFVNFVDLKPLTFNQTPFMLNEFGRYIRNTKLPAHMAMLLGIEILFYIVPLDPAYPATGGTGLAGHLPVKLDNKNSWI